MARSKRVDMIIDYEQIINQLKEAGYWIEAVAGKSESHKKHISLMLNAIDEAVELIQKIDNIKRERK